MSRVYCAGPLFNESERTEMAAIAQVLEKAGHTTFLPHRDGFEYAQLLPELTPICGSDTANAVLQQAIFALDVYELLRACDGVVANLNGRVPDEGTVVEAALAWHARQPLVLYKADDRSLIAGSDNPMIVGLSNLKVVSDLDEIPEVLKEQSMQIGNRVEETLARGREVVTANRDLDHKDLADRLLKLFA